MAATRTEQLRPFHPNVSVSADRRTGRVQIWTRQALDELDERGALRLLKRMLNAVDQVKVLVARKE